VTAPTNGYTGKGANIRLWRALEASQSIRFDSGKPFSTSTGVEASAYKATASLTHTATASG